MTQRMRYLLVQAFLDHSGSIRSGWKILIFLQLIALFARTPLGEFLSFIPFDMDTVLVTLLISFLMLRYFDRKPLRTLGVFPQRGWNRHFWFGALLGALVNLLVFVCMWALGLLSWEFNAQFHFRGFFHGVLIYVFVSTFQELLFRGYLFHRFVEGTGRVAAVFITSVVFALYHVSGGPIGWVNLTLLGMIWGISVLRSGMLWFAIGMHIGWNIFEGLIISMSVSGGGGFSPLLRTQVQGSEMLTGGSFGPEASLIEIPLLLALLIWSFRTPLFAIQREDLSAAEEAEGFKPVWGIALCLLTLVGPVYYLSVHVPSMEDLPEESQVQLPIVLYEAPPGKKVANQVRYLGLKGFRSNAENVLTATVAVDSARFRFLALRLRSASHSYVKRAVINQQYTKAISDSLHYLELPCQLSRLRKNSVLEVGISAFSADSSETVVILQEAFPLRDYVQIGRGYY